MINSEYFLKKSILQRRNEHKIADPGLFEKAIHAFALLGHLAESGMDFIFKGGTSLLLHIPEPQRLSIDIDILCSEDPEKLVSFLEKISIMSPFLRFEEDARGHRGLPERRHFKFYYDSKISQKEDCVLLDVVEEDNCQLPVEEKTIQAIFFETKKDIKVKVSTIEGLLGDKLTAFAPNTIGVPFVTGSGADHSLQVVKQLFDVGQLFNVAEDFKIVFEAYESSFKQENSYKDEKYTKEQVLDDTAEIALKLCRINMKGHKPSDTSESLISGIRKIQNHLISNRFRQDIEAKIAASKAYMLTKMIKAGSFELLSKYGKYTQSQEQIDFIRNISMNTQLDKLKKINPEAFYYLVLGLKATEIY